MRLFDRYILNRIIVGTIFGVFSLSSVLMLGQLFKDIHPLIESQQAPLLQIAKLLWSSIPFMLTFTLPWAFLSSVVLAFGKLSNTNELVGMRMAGWGLGRIALPVALLGALLSAFSFWLNGTIAPRAKNDLKTIVFEAVKKDPQSFLNPGTVQKRLGDDSRLYVNDKIDDTLKGFHFYQIAENEPYPVSYVYAKEVGVTVTEDESSLSLALKETYIENLKESTPFLIADQAQPWVIELPSNNKRRSVSSLTNQEITEELASSGNTMNEKSIRKRVIEIAQRRSMAMGCFCLGIIGVPLGLTSRRKESNSGFFVALIAAACYFGMLLGFEELESSPLVCRILLWSPNVVCLAVAAFFYKRANFA